jgi:hypothetical protein
MMRGQSQGTRERRNEAREPKGNRMTPRHVRGKATWTRTLSVDFRLGGLSGEGRRSIPEGESKKPPPRDWLGSDNDLCIRVLNTHRRLLGGGLGSYMSCVTKDAVRMHCSIRMGMHQMHRHGENHQKSAHPSKQGAADTGSLFPILARHLHCNHYTAPAFLSACNGRFPRRAALTEREPDPGRMVWRYKGNVGCKRGRREEH